MKSKKPLPGRNGFETEPKQLTMIQMQDNKKLHDSQFRFVLNRLSPVLKKHAEILAFFEAKKNHDAQNIVVLNRTRTDRKRNAVNPQPITRYEKQL